ncbi:hypothetical protein HAX54_050417, partial [Datura stramonium]|nr:hypothetical protein [Datura stramonium]
QEPGVESVFEGWTTGRNPKGKRVCVLCDMAAQPHMEAHDEPMFPCKKPCNTDGLSRQPYIRACSVGSSFYSSIIYTLKAGGLGGCLVVCFGELLCLAYVAGWLCIYKLVIWLRHRWMVRHLGYRTCVGSRNQIVDEFGLSIEKLGIELDKN